LYTRRELTANRASLRSVGVRRLGVTGWGLTFAAAAAAGIALRVWVYRSPLGVPNSDEAVIGLMARHMIHGQFTTFVWGQAYGGPLEALLAVPGFVIAGSGWVALRLVTLLLTLVALVLVWRVGLRTVGERAAVVAPALFWVWPPFVILELSHETSFYGFDVVFCALILLLALRVVERPDRTRVGLLGLVIGVAFWETSQIVPVAVGAAIWTVWRQPRALRHAWLAVLLALVGALPWLLWNVRHDWGSFHLPGVPKTSYARRLRLFFSPVLPMMLGLRTPLTQRPLVWSPLVDLLYLGVLALFLVGAWRSRRSPRSLLYLVAGLYPFLYAIAAQTFDSSQPRYLTVLSPVLVVLVAQLLTSWPRFAAAIAIGCAVSVVTLHRMEHVPAPLPAAPRNISPLVATLDRLHLDRVYARYWVAYVLDFDTKERIIAVENRFDEVRFVHGRAVLPDDPVVFSSAYQREVADAPRRGFVFFVQNLASEPIVPKLVAHGYRRVDVGPFAVFAPPAASATV
jgi:4-amino-4-deoxy-L-arabinose transferase-like glycosyltransferase